MSKQSIRLETVPPGAPAHDIYVSKEPIQKKEQGGPQVFVSKDGEHYKVFAVLPSLVHDEMADLMGYRRVTAIRKRVEKLAHMVYVDPNNAPPSEPPPPAVTAVEQSSESEKI